MENRLRSLTENLIRKQTEIEALTSEKNSLYLQLETEKGKVSVRKKQEKKIVFAFRVFVMRFSFIFLIPLFFYIFSTRISTRKSKYQLNKPHSMMLKIVSYLVGFILF